MKRLPNKPYVNEVISRGQNLSLKDCQPFKFTSYIERGFGSFHAVDVKYIGQRAAKLLAFKVGDPLKSLPLQPFQLKCVQVCLARV